MAIQPPGTREKFNFGAGNPDPGVFPPGIGRGRAACSRTRRPGAGSLSGSARHAGLRAVAVERSNATHGVRPSIEDIVITNGAMQGLKLSAQGLAQPATRSCSRNSSTAAPSASSSSSGWS